MTAVFVSGSLSITKLHQLFLKRLESIVESNFDILVGDADGADTSIQRALLRLNAEKVTVYCSGLSPRNNLGKWRVENVETDKEPGSREYFTAKDIEMAKSADYGLMLWDTKSTGTLSNVIELLSHERSSRVFVNKNQEFITVSDASSLKKLIFTMSDGARLKAESKISLSKKIEKIENKQYRMAL